MHVVIPCTRRVHIVATCPCCCDETTVGWTCPLPPCAYTLCITCYEQEALRQGDDAVFQCPLCRRIVCVEEEEVPRTRYLNWQPVRVGHVVLAHTKMYWYSCRPILSKAAYATTVAMVILAWMSIAVTMVLAIGRLVYKMFHGDDADAFVPECETFLCVCMLVLSSVLGLVYVILMVVCAMCLRMCYSIPALGDF